MSKADDLLDNFDGKIVTIKGGKYFGDKGLGIAAFFVLAGCFILPGGLFLMLIGAYFFFTSYGTKIDVSKNKTTDYMKHFDLFETTSEWKDNITYTELAIMGSTVTHEGKVGFIATANYTASKIAINLLDKSHYKRIELCECETVEEAQRVAESISEKTGFPIVKFNPVRIVKTRRR